MTLLQHAKVSEYYRDILKTKNDLKTNACCAPGHNPPSYIQEALSLIEDEILTKFYGCGLPIPMPINKAHILDLGCGTGRDCFILSYLAGKEGHVVGVDMLEEQIGIAKKYEMSQARRFGYDKPNTEFIQGYIEDLESCNLKNSSFDVIVSNCVINLSPQKEKVLKESYRVLKEGGEFFFSDIYADRRLPEWASHDNILLGECLGGALYQNDFIKLAQKIGFHDPLLYSIDPIQLEDKYVIKKIGHINFYSITYRLFKISELEASQEDFGQKAVYRGTIPGNPLEYALNKDYCFKKGLDMPISGNVADIICRSRLAKHFDLKGDKSTHYGHFSHCRRYEPTENGVQNRKTDNKCC